MNSRKRRGSAIIEASLLAPWVLLLFAGVLNHGMYSYAISATGNATRAAALSIQAYTVSTDPTQRLADEAAATTIACRQAAAEMQYLPNVDVATEDCLSSDLVVTAAFVDAASSVDGLYPGWNVAVTYTTVPLMPLPFMPGQMTIVKDVEVRQVPE